MRRRSSTTEQHRSGSKVTKIVAASLIVIALVAVYQYYAVSKQSTFPSTTTYSNSSTAIGYLSLRANDFRFTNTTGCLESNSTGKFEHFVITVINRYHEPVSFVNATILVAEITFVNSTFPIPVNKTILEAGANVTPVLTFAVDFPISGAFFGKSYENTRLDYAPFDVIVYIKQYGLTQKVWLYPELWVFPSTAPDCTK